MRPWIPQLLCVASILSAGCDLAKKAEGKSEEKESDSKSARTEGSKRSEGPIAPRAAKCKPVAWSGLQLVGEAKLEGEALSLLRQQSQVSGAWLPGRVDTSELELSAVLLQGAKLEQFADGVAITFVDGDAPTEPGGGGPALGVPQKPIVAAGIHFPMEQPFFYAELWKGQEGVPFMDEPPAREKLKRAPGERLVELSVKGGLVTLAVHEGPDPSSPAATVSAKLGLSGSRSLGLTGSSGVYMAELGWKELRVAVGDRCLP